MLDPVNTGIVPTVPFTAKEFILPTVALLVGLPITGFAALASYVSENVIKSPNLGAFSG